MLQDGQDSGRYPVYFKSLKSGLSTPFQNCLNSFSVCTYNIVATCTKNFIHHILQGISIQGHNHDNSLKPQSNQHCHCPALWKSVGVISTVCFWMPTLNCVGFVGWF